MKFAQCHSCKHVWLLLKDLSNSYVCPSCKTKITKELLKIVYTGRAHQCKFKNDDGIIMLSADTKRSQMELSWEEFNKEYRYIDTNKYWIKRIV